MKTSHASGISWILLECSIGPDCLDDIRHSTGQGKILVLLWHGILILSMNDSTVIIYLKTRDYMGRMDLCDINLTGNQDRFQISFIPRRLTRSDRRAAIMEKCMSAVSSNLKSGCIFYNNTGRNGAYTEKQALAYKVAAFLTGIGLDKLAGDKVYTKVDRSHQWTKQGVTLLSQVLKWVGERYVQTYHGYIEQLNNEALLCDRQT